MEDRIVTALDIGASKICMAVGQIDFQDDLEILSVNSIPTEQIGENPLANLEKTVKYIQKIVEEVEKNLGCKVSPVTVTISGSHLQSFNQKASNQRDNPSHPISYEEVQQLLNKATSLCVPKDRRILHIFPYYKIDQRNVENPLNLSAVSLEVSAHIITVTATIADNIIYCVNEAGLEVENLIAAPYASALAVLTDEEKNPGSIILDIGAYTTNIACYIDGALFYTNSIDSLGGDLITKDISRVFKLSLYEASQLKKREDCLRSTLSKENNDIINVHLLTNRSLLSIKRKELQEVIRARLIEIFKVIHEELERHLPQYDLLVSGIILTGGGSQLAGIEEVAKEFFNLPTRIGAIKNLKGYGGFLANPSYSALAGALFFAVQKRLKQNKNDSFFSKLKNFLFRLF